MYFRWEREQSHGLGLAQRNAKRNPSPRFHILQGEEAPKTWETQNTQLYLQEQSKQESLLIGIQQDSKLALRITTAMSKAWHNHEMSLPVTSVQLSSESDSPGSKPWIPCACSLWSLLSSSRLALSKSWISFSLVSLKIFKKNFNFEIFLNQNIVLSASQGKPFYS